MDRPAVLELAPAPLRGRFVALEPCAAENRDALRVALDGDRKTWDLIARPGFGEHFDAWWEEAMARAPSGAGAAFAVRRLADGRVVGTTSYLNLSPRDRHVEIGATFYAPEARGGAVNPDCKRLLLAHAFQAGALRVQIVTDARNVRSQAAIAKLGAVREGVLRRHRVLWTGHVRDTVVYSVTDADWPAVRDRLDARLDALG